MIGELLKKKWNPYIRRHSALTEKSLLLPDHILKQHAGWSLGSQMHTRYLHYMANQSNEKLYEAFGIVKKGKDIEQLKPKECPHCGEANEKHNQFCSKCNCPLSLQSYEAIKQKAQKENEQLQQRLQAQQETTGLVWEMMRLMMDMNTERDMEKRESMRQTLIELRDRQVALGVMPSP